jgi:hypothetical protein
MSRLADDRDRIRRLYFSGAVPAFAFASGAIHLYQHREITTVAQHAGDSVFIGTEAISRDLKVRPRRSCSQAFCEVISGALVALPQRDIQNQLRVALDGDETIRRSASEMIVSLCMTHVVSQSYHRS